MPQDRGWSPTAERPYAVCGRCKRQFLPGTPWARYCGRPACVRARDRRNKRRYERRHRARRLAAQRERRRRRRLAEMAQDWT